ncbi:hypothetical protein KOR34_14390 [Posidoniimonas corsicana]|uniref:ImpA N-terminal domain-containing protein n=1 Tax=Posidoniimonas corsicana TaxID=1938618 RepID=A0A5C5VET1_9BACT|nr:type VI secretion system protein TssA [Posidoniimonas corsicana]TWT36533.1 hypothetical protein KOR34_14390 [Posidoniimonas corsicana]
MASVTCESLLSPLEGDSPTGDESHFAMTLAPMLRELRREESADAFDDATRPTQLKRADWKGIVSECEQALAGHAKDLRTACHLAEARAHTDGLGGLREGLELIARLADECWDRVAPAAGDDPAETRGTPLRNLLDDPHRGLCFPNQVRTLPLIGHGDDSRSYVDWTRLRGEPAAESDELAGLRTRITPECFKQNHDDASGALYWLDSLRGTLDERLEADAPGLANLRAALADLQGLLADELARLGFPSAGTEEPLSAEHEAPPAPSTLGSSGREQLYCLLDDTADRLRAMEPHSPIPYLIKRAVRLGRLPFPSLMQHVIREQSTLTELNREFGIAEADGVDASA